MTCRHAHTNISMLLQNYYVDRMQSSSCSFATAGKTSRSLPPAMGWTPPEWILLWPTCSTSARFLLFRPLRSCSCCCSTSLMFWSNFIRGFQGASCQYLCCHCSSQDAAMCYQFSLYQQRALCRDVTSSVPYTVTSHTDVSRPLSLLAAMTVWWLSSLCILPCKTPTVLYPFHMWPSLTP